MFGGMNSILEIVVFAIYVLVLFQSAQFFEVHNFLAFGTINNKIFTLLLFFVAFYQNREYTLIK